jgi:sodium pump decarboxylase gamma subunit
MVLGMGFVYIYLILMILLINFVSKLMSPITIKEQEKNAQQIIAAKKGKNKPQPTGQNNAKLTAAVTAVIQAHQTSK